jgi:hypothetical protein
VPDDDDEEDDGSFDYARALRLVLATLREDWEARDELLDEIGECPCCLREIVLHLAAECATAYVGPPEETPEGGFKITDEQKESAISFISDILTLVLDQRGVTEHHPDPTE